MIEPSLAYLLYQHLSVREPARFSSLDFSDGEYLHVTDLWDACMRQIYFSRETGIPVHRHISPALRMKFEMGKIVEDRIRAWLSEMGVLEEIKPVLKDEDLKIVGSPDGRLKNGRLIEIKGMDPGVFKFTAKGLLPYHSFQMKAYLTLDRQETGKLFSAAFGGSDKIPFRDHTVNFDLKVGEVIKRAVSRLREAKNGGRMPDRVCKAETDPRAVLCPFRRECFDAKSNGLARTIAQMIG